MNVVEKVRRRIKKTRGKECFKSSDQGAVAAYVTYDVTEAPRSRRFKASFPLETDEHGRKKVTIVVYEQ